MIKTCSKCKIERSIEDFYVKKFLGKKGQPLFHSWCKPCSWESDKKIYDRHKDDPIWRRNKFLRNRYRITLDEFNEIWENQGKACAICKDPKAIPLVVDHDHEAGHVRGILCNNCNAGLGFFRENIKILKGAIDYLEIKYIVIDEDGSIFMLYNDTDRDFLDSAGQVSISRVSNVEPGIDGLWYTYIINGPTIGGFKLRQDALDAEVEYINREILK